MKVFKLLLTLFLSLCVTSVLGQESLDQSSMGVLSESPVNGSASTKQVGNDFLPGGCNKGFGIVIKPECIGANLRSVSNPLDPEPASGNVVMDFVIPKSDGSNYEGKVSFSPKITWPASHVKTCEPGVKYTDVNTYPNLSTTESYTIDCYSVDVQQQTKMIEQVEQLIGSPLTDDNAQTYQVGKASGNGHTNELLTTDKIGELTTIKMTFTCSYIAPSKQVVWGGSIYHDHFNDYFNCSMTNKEYAGDGALTYDGGFKIASSKALSSIYPSESTWPGFIAKNQSTICQPKYAWRTGTSSGLSNYLRDRSTIGCKIQDPNEDMASLVKLLPFNQAAPPEMEVEYGSIAVYIKDQAVANGIDISNTGVISVTFKQEERAADGSVTGYRTLGFLGEPAKSGEQHCLVVRPQFVGKAEYCGSYKSPLMFFFSNQRPKFNGRSTFPIYPDVRVVYWMEKNHPGYLLALDKKGDGKITEVKQLFGQDEQYPNGFEALKRFDRNYDYKIDAKDDVYKKLVLWKDKNGNGISEKGEVFKLKDMGVESISLYYNNSKDHYKYFSNRATARESGKFSYKKNGKKKSGAVIDIYFAAHPDSRIFARPLPQMKAKKKAKKVVKKSKKK